MTGIRAKGTVVIVLTQAKARGEKKTEKEKDRWEPEGSKGGGRNGGSEIMTSTVS